MSGEAIDAAPAQALAGLRVIELTAGMAGPWIGRFMAWCGAEVIRVESRRHPDVVRLYVPPRAAGPTTEPEMSPWFTDWNAGKRFVALDLAKPQAVALAKALVAKCDIVIENYSCGVLDKLGLGYDDLRRVRADIIMFGSSGYGQSGPNRGYVTWGPNIEALSGLSSVSGFAHRRCTVTQYAYPDALSALHGLFAVMCALEHRRRSGRGQYINLSQLEATVGAIGHVVMEQLANGTAPERLGNRSLQAAPHGCYPCKGDDRWCTIAVFGDEQWQRFCRAAGHAEWAADSRFDSLARRLANVEALDTTIGQWTSKLDAYELMYALQEVGVAAGVVQTAEDQLRRDEHLASRGYFEEIAHLKKGSVIANGIPLGLTATPGRTTYSGASVGHDNEYVFGSLLGLSDEEIAGYVAAGAIE